MDNSHRVVFVAANAQQAHLLRNLLIDEGIEAYVTNTHLDGTHFEPGDLLVRLAGGPGFHPNLPRVVVHQDDEESARQIVVAAEAALQEGATDEELDALQRTVDAELTEWPLCPDCRRRRLAVCPVCRTSGVDFPRAFMPGAELADGREDSAGKPAPLLLLCPTCDEAFAAKHPARCEWCGHPFADGRPESEGRSTPLPRHESQGNPWRATLVVALILATVAGVLLWFASLSQ